MLIKLVGKNLGNIDEMYFENKITVSKKWQIYQGLKVNPLTYIKLTFFYY